jgi:hypothetical protein
MTVPSIRQLAPLLGISHTMLNRQFKRGKFRAESDGGFDPEKVRAALTSTANLDQPSQAKGTQRQAPPVEREEPSDDSAFRMFNRAKAFKEQVRAKHAELDLKRRMGELIDAKEAEAAWGKAVMNARNKALLLPGELAPKLAVATDVAACEEILKTGIYEMLSDLAQPHA